MLKKNVKTLTTTLTAILISIATLTNFSGTITISAAEPRVNWGLFSDEYVGGYIDNGDNYARISCSVCDYTGALGAVATDVSDFKIAGIAKDTMGNPHTIILVESDGVYSCTASYKKQMLNYGMSYVEGTVYVCMPGPETDYQKRNIKADFRMGTREFGEVQRDFVAEQLNQK